MCALFTWPNSLYRHFRPGTPAAQRFPSKATCLFTLTPDGRPITDMSLGRIVAAALKAIEFSGVEPNPRTLRNTFCRRQLLAGCTHDDVTRILGLASNRTSDRIAATISAARRRKILK